MKTLMILLALLMLSSCSLEKRVIVTTRGYESYRQTGMTEVQIKGLQRADAARTDSLIIYKFK
jgi:hypothetical protein